MTGARWSPRDAMVRAIAEAHRGAGFVSPNPLVGCVILDADFALLATGYHARLGERHAETNALAAVSDPARLKGAHVFVTLEPCAHQGRQPSCARTLAALPIASVTYGIDDPDPRVSGRGVEILRAGGIRVERFGDLREELAEVAEIFLVNQGRQRPFVALKVATSFDGQVALTNGRSQWITGPGARARVQAQRGAYDAVLTGVGTILADDPRLDARDERYAGRPNRLIILDPRGRVTDGFGARALATVRAPSDVLLVTAPGAPAPPGVRRIACAPNARGFFDLSEVLTAVRAEGVHSVYVEAGPRTTSAFLNAGLVDRLFTFLAPKLLGAGLGWTSGRSITDLTQAIRLEGLRFESLGGDWLATAKVQTLLNPIE